MSFFTILGPKRGARLWFSPKNQVSSNHRYGVIRKVVLESSREKLSECFSQMLENRTFPVPKKNSFTFDQPISRKCRFKFSQTILVIIYWHFSENFEKTQNRNIVKRSRFYSEHPKTMKSALYPKRLVVRLNWEPNRTGKHKMAISGKLRSRTYSIWYFLSRKCHFSPF